jgi:ADP-ribose pyrophosphatase YjhB (NUDIX family)
LYGKETKSHWLSVQSRTVLEQRSPPGDHVEFDESVLDTARRETMEEIGTEIENLEVLGFTEDIAQDNHYITVWVRSDWASGELKTRDAEFTESGLFKMDDLPEPLFISFRNLMDGKLMPKPLKLGSIV